MKSRLLLYGVDHYAGGLISRRAAEKGFAHIAAGPDIARVATLANELSRNTPNLVEPRIFGLGDKARLAGQLDDVAVVVNCCPQISEVAPALIEACLGTHTNYLDLSSNTLEIRHVFELDSEGRAAGISLVPGVSFGVSAVEAMVSRLATICPAATHLSIAVSRSPYTRAEAQHLVAACRTPGHVLKNGAMVEAHAGDRAINIDFGNGPMIAHLAPWRSESFIAGRLGPFKNVESYEVFPPALVRAVTKSGWRRWMFRRGMRLAAMERKIAGRLEGPTARQLAKTPCVIWGEARDAEGRISRARLETPAAPIYTAAATLALARALMDGKIAPGAHFPSQVAGAALIENIEGVHWRELPDMSEVNQSHSMQTFPAAN
tara:strand:- start:2749 stop:3876 length:1128 start_codon:yes stop_codon:yes gene_type:complete